MPITQINPEKAKQILDENPQAVYVDVRSVAEFIQGHAAGAINIPIFHKTPQGVVPNPDFVPVIQAHLKKDQTLVVGCQMGGRSQQACQVLAQSGYTNLHNIQGGFGGSPTEQGWRDLGFPVSEENGEGVGYESLAKVTS